MEPLLGGGRMKVKYQLDSPTMTVKIFRGTKFNQRKCIFLLFILSSQYCTTASYITVRTSVWDSHLPLVYASVRSGTMVYGKLLRAIGFRIVNIQTNLFK